jgi:hypothetical protein
VDFQVSGTIYREFDRMGCEYSTYLSSPFTQQLGGESSLEGESRPWIVIGRSIEKATPNAAQKRVRPAIKEFKSFILPNLA